jgi:hypothetical protein
VLIDDSNASRAGRVGSVRILRPLLLGRPVRETILSWRRPYLLSFSVKGHEPIHHRVDVLSLDSDGISSVRFRWVIHGRLTGSRLSRWWTRRQLQSTIEYSWRRLQKRFPYR